MHQNIQHKFSKLNKREVSREEITIVINEAKKANETEIVYRLSTVLNANPKTEDFHVELTEYPTQLGSPKHAGNYKEALTPTGRLRKGFKFEKGRVIKTVSRAEKKPKTQTRKKTSSNGVLNAVLPQDKSFLAGLEFIAEKDDSSLNAPVKSEDIYKMVTDKLLKTIENKIKSTGDSWDRSFTENGGYLRPHNFESKNPYRGINILLLNSYSNDNALTNPYFLTFKQIQKNKGKLKKGSKGTPVIYFTLLYKLQSEVGKKDSYGTYDIKKIKKYLISKGFKPSDFDKEVAEIPILKYYNVFNGADIEGIDFELDSLTEKQKAKFGFISPSIGLTEDRIVTADLIVKHFPKDSAVIKKITNKRAYYNPGADLVNMPTYKAFKSSADYYRVLFHEMIHSTGHRTRLNRKFGNTFGSVDYAKEEIVAEFGATFLSSYAGILWRNIDKHTDYIKSWKSAIKHIKKDNKLVMRCATQSQKATDLLLQVKNGSEPAFYKDLGKEKTVSKKPKLAKKKPIPKEGEQLTLALAGLPSFKTLKETKKYYLSWALDNLRGVKKYHEGIGKNVVFNRKGIEHSLSYKTNIPKIKLIVQAEKMLEESEFISFEADKKKRAEIKGVYRMSTTAIIEGKKTEVLLTLREGLNGVVYYNHEIEGIKKLRSTSLGEKTPIVKSSNEVKPTESVMNIKNKEKNEDSQKKGLGNPNSELQVEILGYQNASVIPENSPDIFRLNGDLGEFIQDLQRYKELIIIKGGKHSNKSQLAMQIADAFAVLMLRVFYIDYEQGGIACKDTQDSINRNTTEKGRKNIFVKGFIENPMLELEDVAKQADVLIADSVTDLGISADQLNELRNKYPKVIWCFISQVKENGEMYGGNKMAHNPTKIIVCHSDKDFKKRYASLEKSRGNSLDPKYNIFSKEIIEEEDTIEIVV